ncbi:MAG: DUF4389 domain-containing protein [Candidatus Eisenbacteria bacterium]
MPDGTVDYPARLSIDYPAKCDRLTTFFRLVAIIPIAIILWMLADHYDGRSECRHWYYMFTGMGYVFGPTVLMILFRKKYPKWWYDWNIAMLKFETRVVAYFALLTHEYPSTDEEQAVHIEVPYPDAEKDLLRGLPLIKWLLVVPHVIVLMFLGIAAIVCVIIAWFAILINGTFPRELFDFVVGVMRWSMRVSAYSALLTTDQYPPFSLS